MEAIKLMREGMTAYNAAKISAVCQSTVKDRP